MDNYSQSQLFKPVRTIALWTMTLLGLSLILDIVNISINLTELVLASKYPETVAAALSEEGDSFTDMPGGVLQATVAFLELGMGVFFVLVSIGTIVVFLIWMHRSYKNLKPLGSRRMEYSPAWAVGCWFVPFVNLVRPYGMIKEIWFKSDPDTVELEDSPLSYTLEIAQIAAPMFGLWWAFWIISNVFTNISTRLTFGADTLDQHVTSFWLSIIASALSIVAAALAISVVRAITARQEARYKRIVDLTRNLNDESGMPPMPPTYAPPSFS
ncbi:MAG TPA: DUF4328 domain-containing protein [Blastocatellia bacterium]|nr:DUF4328 domain-containing protein [Blastocatellia bacterium]